MNDAPAHPAVSSEASPSFQAPVEERARWLEAKLRSFSALHAEWAGRESRASWSRLAIFVITLAVAIWQHNDLRIAAAVALVGAIIFILAVRWHGAARQQREFGDRLLRAAAETRQRLGGSVVCIREWRMPADEPGIDALLKPDPAGIVWPLTGQELDDLDLFAAPVGVFGLLNRTSTAPGARRLRDALRAPTLSAERILRRQAAVHWLAENADARLHLLAGCGALRNEDRRLARLVRALGESRALALPFPVAFVRVAAVLVGLLATYSLGQVMFGNSVWLPALAVALLVNGSLYLLVRGQVSQALDLWRDVAWAVSGCASAAKVATERLPEAGLLGEMRRRLAAACEPSTFPRLARRLGWAEGGGLMQIAINLLFLADLQVAHSILRIAVARREELLDAISALADLELNLSLGCFAWEQPVAAMPVPCESVQVRIVGGRHPLVDPARVVPNDVELDGVRRAWIVTGSNMAGKSTLLRMVGVNTLLAQVGSAVAAEEMRWSPLRLITDLRARDNLAESESYFLAEVRHLRRLVTPPAGSGPILGLIDEPFRGTNSDDQTAASVAVVRHLLASAELFLLATHDRHLTTLADGNVARNFHFRENLGVDGGMVFDYRLHEGPATTRNALRVLEREGYPPTLLDEARDWLRSPHVPPPMPEEPPPAPPVNTGRLP